MTVCKCIIYTTCWHNCRKIFMAREMLNDDSKVVVTSAFSTYANCKLTFNHAIVAPPKELVYSMKESTGQFLCQRI